MMSARVGMMAPEFKTKAFVGGEFKDVSLKQFQGKWVCLFFYPLDFTFVCPTEILAFAELESKFKAEGCELLACSTDSHFTHKAWYEKDLKAVKFPVLADTNHEISKSFGVLLENEGIALRGTFLIDPKGVLHSMQVNALDIGRNPEETLRTLQAAKTGELCPANWKPGQKTLS